MDTSWSRPTIYYSVKYLNRRDEGPYTNMYQDKALFQKVMDDLVSGDVLENYKMTPKKDGKKIIDWRFDLSASTSFAKQMAANNKVSNAIKGIYEGDSSKKSIKGS